MHRRLMRLFVLVAAAGLVQLAVYAMRPDATSRDPNAPTRLARALGSCANLLAPREPPSDPPPGRPFAKDPISFTGSVPTNEELQAAVRGTNVVICVLDAARVDHFGAYGYARDTTPNFDRLAKEAVLFEQHYCEQPETGPSTASLLTGQYPDTHGVLSNMDVLPPADPQGSPVFTLERALGQAGFATMLLSSNNVVGPEYGLRDDFGYTHTRGSYASDAALLPGEFQRALRRPQASGKPFFAYIHFLPPHTPYEPPKQFLARYRGKRPPRYWHGAPAYPATRSERQLLEPPSLAEWANLYDANLRWADALLGETVEVLRQAGALERTLLIVTADHGESMREHDYAFHAACPYDEALHIPLLVRFPGPHRPVGAVHALTQTIDLLPTLLALYDVRYPPRAVQGRSLVPLLTGTARAAHDCVVSRVGRAWHTEPCYSVRDAHTALLLYDGGTRRALYDLDRDPWQTSNVYAQEPSRAAALEKAFQAFAQQQRYRPAGFLGREEASSQRLPPPRRKLTVKQRETLRGLGYVR